MSSRKRDFSLEIDALHVLTMGVSDLSKEIDFSIEGTSAAFTSFYRTSA